jgi:SapC
MFKELVPVSRERHGEQRVRPLVSFEFARGFHLASVMMHEFSRAQAFNPIVFIDDSRNGVYRPVALFGLEAGENLFIDPVTAQWQSGAYIPAIIRRYPFALATTDQSDRYAICVDEGSGHLDAHDGQAMFNADGSPSETLENVKRFLGELQGMEEATRVRDGEGARDIAGSYVVADERLDALDEATFLDLRTRRYLAPLYAHLGSLAQLERLVRAREARRQQTAAGAKSARTTRTRSRGASGRK